jgi:hypothetical protein
VLVSEPYNCTPICRIVLVLERFSVAIGPAGDVVYVPFRILGGTITGMGPDKPILGGTDFGAMYADEKFTHNGNFVVRDPAGDILIWYDGPSQGPEGTYDDVLDGNFVNKLTCRLAVRTVSVNAGWRSLNRRPLLGMGTFEGESGVLAFTVLSLNELRLQN